MRLLVLSLIDDWDLGPQLKACGHDIVAWVRPTWERGPRYGPLYQAIRTTLKVILSRSKPSQAIKPGFDTWTWLDKEKIPRISCPSVNAHQFIEYVRGLEVDLIVVCVFPQILKAPILQTPRLGVLNYHPSLLPRYAGPQPAFWMLRNGESVAGITVHVMTERIDAGDIVAQRELSIEENENAGELLQRQHHAAAALVTQAVNAMPQGTVELKPQESSGRSYFGKRKTADTILDWSQPAREIANLLRAVQPYESLMASLNGKSIKIYHAQPQEGSPPRGVAGQIIAKQRRRILVQTGDGYLEITSYEIAPFHGWVNRILQRFLLPVGSRFDRTPAATTGQASKSSA